MSRQFWMTRFCSLCSFQIMFIPMRHKRKLFNMTILPAFVYGCETWSLRQSERKKLAVAQRKMERRMAGVTLLDRRSNVWLRGVTRVRDVNVELAKRKWNWAYKISNYPIERWPRIVAEWRPYGLRTKKEMERRTGGIK